MKRNPFVLPLAIVLLALVLCRFVTPVEAQSIPTPTPMSNGQITLVWPSLGMDPNDRNNWTWGTVDGKAPSKALISVNGEWWQLTPACPEASYFGYYVAWGDGVASLYVEGEVPPMDKLSEGRGDDLTQRGMECGYHGKDETAGKIPVTPTATPSPIPTEAPTAMPQASPTPTATPTGVIGEPASEIKVYIYVPGVWQCPPDYVGEGRAARPFITEARPE